MIASPPSDDAPSGRPGRCLDIGWLAVVAWSLFRIPPWRPLFLFESDGVDPSWLGFLNEAATREWHFGSDIAFTYGPLGFLHGRVFHPETSLLLMAGWLAVACVLATSLWQIAAQLRTSPLTRLLGVVLAVEMLSRDVMALCFSLQAALFLAVVPLQQAPRECLSDIPPPRSRLIIGAVNRLLLVLLIAALPWVKFSYLPSVAGLTICVGLARLWHRQFPVEAAGLVIASLTIWFATGHTADDLIGYVINGLELSRGYSAAMGTSPEALSGWVAVIFAALITLCLPWWFSVKGYDRSIDRWLATLFFGGLMFLVFKSTFVRWHSEKLSTFLDPVVLLLVIGYQCDHRTDTSPGTRWINPVLAVASCLFGAAWLVCSGPGHARPLLAWLSGPTALQVESLADTAHDATWRTARHQSRLEQIRQTNPIPEVTGSVDAFPSKLISPLAHGLDLKPRPVIQSYAAYTAHLLEANRAHFASRRAPSHVLLSVSAIDKRLPTMDDGPTWLELLRRYHPVEAVDGTLRLDRLPTPRTWQRELVCSQTLNWNETWCCDQFTALLESGGWLLCTIDCRPSLTGKVAATLYRLPPVHLQVTVGSQVQTFRLIPACAREGFLLSPLVATGADLRRLWEPWLRDSKFHTTRDPATAHDRLQALALTTPMECCFDELIELKLWRLTPLQTSLDSTPGLARFTHASE